MKATFHLNRTSSAAEIGTPLTDEQLAMVTGGLLPPSFVQPAILIGDSGGSGGTSSQVIYDNTLNLLKKAMGA